MALMHPLILLNRTRLGRCGPQSIGDITKVQAWCSGDTCHSHRPETQQHNSIATVPWLDLAPGWLRWHHIRIQNSCKPQQIMYFPTDYYLFWLRCCIKWVMSSRDDYIIRLVILLLSRGLQEFEVWVVSGSFVPHI